MHEDHILPLLRLVEGIVSSLARRRHLSRADAEDLAGAVRLKLLQHDRAAHHMFRRVRNVEGFLAAMVHSQYVDFLIARNGKWRPSREAQRLGWIAERMEALLVHDRLSFSEACEVLRTNDRVKMDDAAFDALYAKLPMRTTRQFVSVEALESLGQGSDEVEEAADRHMRERARQRVSQALATCTGTLSDEDRLILKLYIDDDRQVSVIARMLGLKQKRLYPRIKRLLKRLRGQLESCGVTPDDIKTVLLSAAAESTERSTVAPDLRIQAERPHHE